MKIPSLERCRFLLLPPPITRRHLACLVALLTLAPGARAQGNNAIPATGPTVSGLDQIILANAAEQAGSAMFNEKVQRLWIDDLNQAPAHAGRTAVLPPLLPVMLEPVVPGTATAASLPHQAKLAPCAGDTYYMAYTSLLRQDAWSDRRAKRLEASLAVRRKLSGELRVALAQSAGRPAGERATLLAGCARAQSSALQALEAEDESMRLDLTTRTAFRPYENGLHLPISGNDGPPPPPVATVLLFAVQFDPGLSPAQRELLQGVFQDLCQSPSQAAASFSFWPARARLPRPAGLAADLTLQLQRVQELKQKLAREIVGVLNRKRDDARTADLASLAGRQAPEFVALDNLADTIRPQLEAYYAPDAPPVTSAPDALLAQVARAFARKSALQHRVNAEIRELRRLLPNDKIELVQQDQAPSIVHTPGPPSAKARPLTAAETRILHDRLKKTNDEVAQRTQALVKESQELQEAVRDYRDRILQAPQQNLGELAATLVQTVAMRENERLYRDYRAAVLEPGLSPEQRRLLLRESLAEIELTRLRDPWAE
ncbi:MAG TPA: hypothetical protein VG734_04015 [Lacunisphaera sp.]|nr:hypothetical protein [Lacunisphaera sp.]